MLNKIFLQGRLVADPELRHTPSGVAVTTFRMAVDRDFKNRETGEKQADFFNAVAFKQTAEFISRYFTKGSMAIVEGKLQNRDYTDRDGNRRFFTEVIVDSIHFGSAKRDSDNGGYYSPRPAGNNNNAWGGYGASSAPAAPQANNSYPSGGGYPATPAVDQFADLTDDDGELPF